MLQITAILKGRLLQDRAAAGFGSARRGFGITLDESLHAADILPEKVIAKVIFRTARNEDEHLRPASKFYWILPTFRLLKKFDANACLYRPFTFSRE